MAGAVGAIPIARCKLVKLTGTSVVLVFAGVAIMLITYLRYQVYIEFEEELSSVIMG